jgi:hypothetical protein
MVSKKLQRAARTPLSGNPDLINRKLFKLKGETACLKSDLKLPGVVS